MVSHYTAACTLKSIRKIMLITLAVVVALSIALTGGTMPVVAEAEQENASEAGVPEIAEDEEEEEEDAGRFTVTLRVDGEFFDHETEEVKVADLLRDAGIELGELDEVSDPLDDWVEDGDIISVTRHLFVTVEKEEVLPSYQEHIPTSLLKPGKTRILSEGENGLQVNTYSQYYIGGKLVEEELIESEVVEEAVATKLLVGTDSAPVSPLDFGHEFDENGIPADYVDVFKLQRATGYSAKPGARTASGRKAEVGYVAVNPREIPYGTKMYIQSADGRFVYGYAIAADTGTALMDGRVDVDLFYGTYMESKLNGLRQVDIYILEYPQ